MIDEIKDAIGREFSTQTPGHIKYKNIIHFLENGIVKELEASRELIATHIKDRRDLKSQNKKLRECVEFYGELSKWETEDSFSKEYTMFCANWNNDFENVNGLLYGGKKARECLKEIDSE